MPVETSLAEQAERYEAQVLMDVQASSDAPWLMYTLTMKDASRGRLLHAQRRWKEGLEDRLGLPHGDDGLQGYRVIEPHESGAPHLHGLIRLPREADLPRQLREGRRASGFRYLASPEVKSSVHDRLPGPWIAARARRDWVLLTRRSAEHAATIDVVRDGKAAIRYCTKSFVKTGMRSSREEEFDRDFEGRWSFETVSGALAPRRRIRISSVRRRSRQKIETAKIFIQRYVIGEGLRDSRAIRALLEPFYALGWFSPRTFAAAKRELGMRSTPRQQTPGRFRPGRWSWADNDPGRVRHDDGSGYD
jgi:hypothetical protein